MSQVANSQVVIVASSIYFPVQAIKGWIDPLHIGYNLSKTSVEYLVVALVDILVLADQGIKLRFQILEILALGAHVSIKRIEQGILIRRINSLGLSDQRQLTWT